MFKRRTRTESVRLRVLGARELSLVTGGGDSAAPNLANLANADREFVPGNVRGQPAVNTPSLRN